MVFFHLCLVSVHPSAPSLMFTPRLNLIIERAHYQANVNVGSFETPWQLIMRPANWLSRIKKSEIRQVRHVSMLLTIGSRIYCWRLDRGSSVDSELVYVHTSTCSSVRTSESIFVRSVETRTDHRRTHVVHYLWSIVLLLVQCAFPTYCAFSLVRLL